MKNIGVQKSIYAVRLSARQYIYACVCVCVCENGRAKSEKHIAKPLNVVGEMLACGRARESARLVIACYFILYLNICVAVASASHIQLLQFVVAVAVRPSERIIHIHSSVLGLSSFSNCTFEMRKSYMYSTFISVEVLTSFAIKRTSHTAWLTILHRISRMRFLYIRAIDLYIYLYILCPLLLHV